MCAGRLSSFAAILLVFLAAPVLACSPGPDFTFEKAFADATLVFRGLVTEAKLNPYVQPPGPAPGENLPAGDVKGRILVDVKYELLETFKGLPDLNGMVTTTSMIMGGCGVPVMPGWQFLFVVTPFEGESPPGIVGNSQGMIWVYSTWMLPAYAPRLDEELAEVRTLARKR